MAPPSRAPIPDHWIAAVKQPGTNLLRRRADVVGIYPNDEAVIRFGGAVLLEANDEWQMQHRYMGVEAMGEMLNPPPTNATPQLLPKAV